MAKETLAPISLGVYLALSHPEKATQLICGTLTTDEICMIINNDLNKNNIDLKLYRGLPFENVHDISMQLFSKFKGEQNVPPKST